MSPLSLNAIPSIRVGGPSYRFSKYRFLKGFVPEVTDFIPRMLGGSTIGGGTAHKFAADLALERYRDLPVLLLEDDATKTNWFSPELVDVPQDADIIWLGRSVATWKGIPSPTWSDCQNRYFVRLTGLAQACHAMLLKTAEGKQAWKQFAEQAMRGEFAGNIDLAASLGGATSCRQYISKVPLYYQPDHPATAALLPLQLGGKPIIPSVHPWFNRPRVRELNLQQKVLRKLKAKTRRFFLSQAGV